MVKLQPSKLITRVRFPLPALFQIFNLIVIKMKKFGICAMLALLAFGAMPVVAVGPTLDKAVALAAQDSGARISDICYAVYKAVKEAPEEADVVFSRVIAQRTTWTSGEVYAIFRAVLLARPDLEAEFRTHVASYKGGHGLKGKDSYSGDAAKDPMLYKLLTALHEASLPDGVVPAVLNALQNNAIDLAMINQSVIDGRIGGPTSDPSINEPSPNPPGGDVPTPKPMSPQN